MQNVIRTEEFDLAYKFITETHLNVFLTGKAGTGKTTFLKHLKSNSHKSIVVAAPTGVAAINAGGVTLHSLFQLPFAPFVPGRTPQENTLRGHSLLSQIKFNKLKRKTLTNMDLLVIDEVSMVAANTLDSIDIILRSIRKCYTIPFGGVQVLFIGDLHQLPPVVKRDTWSLLKEFYPSFFFFDSLVMRAFPPVMVELTTVYRQSDNTFVDILNGVRNNELTKKHLSVLNDRIDPNFKAEEGYITLSTHNNQSDTINQEKMDTLEEKRFIYSAVIKNEFPESMFPVNQDLELKLGAQVMFVRNDNEDKKYFNGKIGVVSSLTDNKVKVLCPGDDSEISVQLETWKNIHYKVDEVSREIEEEELGSFTQFPLRLAWAITIHKSQGLTFEKLIVDAERAFANGQVYVALSRCTSLEGMVLTSPISQKFLGASGNLTKWEDTHNKPEELPTKLIDSRIECLRQELLIVYDWTGWIEPCITLQNSVKSLADKLSVSLDDWMQDLVEKALELNKVAKGFQGHIVKLTSTQNFDKDKEELFKRLKDSSNYFLDKLEAWIGTLKEHDLEVKTKKAAEEIDQPMEEIALFFHDLQYRLKYLQEKDFDLGEYLDNGKVNKGRFNPVKSAYLDKKPTKSLISAEEIVHIKLYQKLAQYRKQKSQDLSMPIYRVFSNYTIKDLCSQLPQKEEDLTNVNGFGPTKVKQFGKEVARIIRKYCEENQVPAKDLFS